MGADRVTHVVSRRQFEPSKRILDGSNFRDKKEESDWWGGGSEEIIFGHLKHDWTIWIADRYPLGTQKLLGRLTITWYTRKQHMNLHIVHAQRQKEEFKEEN